MKSHVVISAVGLVNALGSSVDVVTEALFQGDQSGIRLSDSYIPGRSCFVGGVRDELPSCPACPEALDGREINGLWSRNAALSFLALNQVLDHVRAAIKRYGRSRVGIVMGSSTSGIEEGEKAVASQTSVDDLPAGYAYAQQQMGTVSDVLSLFLGTAGPSYTISTACSSSAKVFRSARNLIQSGWCDCVVVGGFDSLCKLTLNGFSALELVSDEVTNPFSKNRKGITIGEGGALFLLERCDESELTDDSIRVLGVGESSDAYHISSPDPSASGAIAAIQAALDQAGLQATDIDYVNLHGTGTSHNDAMEAKAIASIFPEETPCSSTKPLVGHMLGASGATEAAFCWMVLRDSLRRLPPHRFDGEQDPEFAPLNLVKEGATAGRQPRYVLSNSFGFGGSNCAVVLGRGR